MEFSVLSVPSILQNAVVLTVIIAFAGYIITSWSAHMLAQAPDREGPRRRKPVARRRKTTKKVSS